MEHCTSDFFQECDADKDKQVSFKEWGHCFGIKDGKIHGISFQSQLAYLVMLIIYNMCLSMLQDTLTKIIIIIIIHTGLYSQFNENILHTFCLFPIHPCVLMPHMSMLAPNRGHGHPPTVLVTFIPHVWSVGFSGISLTGAEQTENKLLRL